MNKTLVILVLVLVVGAGAWYILRGNQAATGTPVNEESNLNPAPDESGPEGLPAEGETREFTVEGTNFSFSVKEMRVKKGDTVKVTFVNKDGFHDWVLDEYNVKTKQLASDASETVEFVADQAGTFEYYCSVGKHRQNGMIGQLIVE